MHNKIKEKIFNDFKKFCDNTITPKLLRRIKEFYRVVRHPAGTGPCLHELIRYELIKVCVSIPNYHLGEFPDLKKDLRRRIDLICSGERSFNYAFEIDKGINLKSIKKLRTYPWDVCKCIVFYGPKIPLKETYLLEPDIHYIDVTEENLYLIMEKPRKMRKPDPLHIF